MAFDSFANPRSEAHYIHRPLKEYYRRFPMLIPPGHPNAPSFNGEHVDEFFVEFERMGARLGFTLVTGKELIGHYCTIRTRALIWSCAGFHRIQSEFEAALGGDDYDHLAYSVWRRPEWQRLRKQVKYVFNNTPPFELGDVTFECREFSRIRHLNLFGYELFYVRFCWIAGWLYDRGKATGNQLAEELLGAYPQGLREAVHRHIWGALIGLRRNSLPSTTSVTDVHHTAHAILYAYEHPYRFEVNMMALMEEQGQIRWKDIEHLPPSPFCEGLIDIEPKFALMDLAEQPQAQMMVADEVIREMEEDKCEATGVEIELILVDDD